MLANSHVLALPTERKTDDRPAIVVPLARAKPSITSYAQLNSLVGTVQRSLAQNGVTKGSKVALILPNGLELVVAFLALLRQRAVAALLNPQLKQEEYRQMLENIQPTLVIVLANAADLPTGADGTGPAMLVAAELGFSAVSCRVEQGEVHLEKCGLDGPGDAVSSQTAARVFSAQEIEADDKALLLLTSGTTGRPKAVTLSHANLLVAMRIIASAHVLSPLDRCLIITPLFHIIGIGGSLLTTLFTGGCVVIPPSLSGSLWKTCEDFQITWFHAVPTLYRLIADFPLLEDGKFPPTLRFLRSGGSDMPPNLYDRLSQLGPPILEVYGMTETGPAIFCNRLDPGPGKGRRLGHYPVADTVEVMILPSSSAGDEDQNAGQDTGPGTTSSRPDDPLHRLTSSPGVSGEICVRGRSVMSGYVDNAEADAEAFLSNGFFRTGDLGVLHPDGYVQLFGRLKEIINKGGEKVSPSDIEHLILSHESVKGAACFRVPDEIYGEDIGVAVVLHAGKDCKPAGLKKHVRQNAALFKVPKVVVFVDSIPTNRTGKPMRSFLAQQYADGLLKG